VKKIFLLLTFFIFNSTSAQLDTEHWFAPFAASLSGNNNQLDVQSYLYLSTNETIPFSVEVYQDENLFATVQISKGNAQVLDIPYQKMITADVGDMFKPVPMGLHVKGSKRFFANFRFSVPNHAEIITSKGLAGLGKTFFAAMARNTVAKNYLTSTIGIIATEDNTIVKISGYNPGIVFFDGTDGTSSPTKTATLKRGESYIVNVISSSNAAANLDGLIGAKIEASEPISVTNGNFNAIYTTENYTNNDILMDQSVPIERLGKDFVLVKGNGPPFNNMESGLIVATEDNTEISINGAPVGVVLNTGQYFIADSSFYVLHGSDHYSMSISTTKNAYLYQLLAGVADGNPYATGGFNFVPALSCFLPNKIDELSDINLIGSQNFNTKLNIITETGASVQVNGVTLSGNEGPFPVTGNPNWETYNVLNVSGNITVNSTRSVTAGIAAGNGAVGYGGYFAGFSSVPVISKTGDCFTGVTLQVDDSYDQYQWYLNGVLIPGETKNFLNPQQYGSGNYTCNITKTNCDTKLTTPYQFVICPPLVTTHYILGSCKTITIQPAFSNSTQTINPSKTKIQVQGTSGKATIDSTTGIITYTPKSDLTTDISDFFVYYIEGNGTPEDSEFFKVTIDLKVLTVTDDSLKVCENADGTGTFNLTSAKNSTDPANTILYFSDINHTQPITNFTNYISAPKTVYAQITSPFGCVKSANINLETAQIAQINLANFNSTFCDDLFAGSINLKLSDLNSKIVSNFSPNFVIKYYLNSVDQQNGANNYLPYNFTYSTTTTIYFRVENVFGCTPKFGQFDLKVGNRITLLKTSTTETLCDNELIGNVTIDLGNYKTIFSNDSSLPATYFLTEFEAEKKQNPISASQVISGNATFYFRFESTSECPVIAELNLVLNKPKKSDILVDKTICPDAKTDLDAGLGFDSYLWNTGEKTSKINVPVGEYYVDLGFNNCIYRQKVSVKAVELPKIINIEVVGNTATIFVTGGNPPYEYALDSGNYQTSNIFSNIPRGIHQVYVKDANNCETVEKEFLIINLINVITPNSDGKNDILDYSDLKIKKDVSISIYDRFGTMVFQSQNQQYIWDGKLNGRVLATGSYWYILNWTEPDTNLPVSYKGWVLLKNRN
jgi:gliding motility-associated-like protein